jgi:hypothetical protein
MHWEKNNMVAGDAKTKKFAENQKTRLSYGNFLGKPGKKLIAMGSTICSFYYKLYYKFSKRADTKNSY